MELSRIMIESTQKDTMDGTDDEEDIEFALTNN